LKPSQTAVRYFIFGLLAAPLVAQTQIGGGTCSSASLNGTYAVSLTGRQVSASGTFMSVLQANGSATFDGLSMVTFSLTENTNQALGMPQSWSGTYSVQANCAALVNITSGGDATLNVMAYNQGKDFLMTGSDASYSYSGSGVTQPTGCSASTLNGVYTFNATGFALSTTSVSGTADGAGLLQFDGQGNLTVNVSSTTGGNTTATATLTGSYSISSNCLGSAMLTDSSSNSYLMSFSIYSVAVANTNFYASLARASNFLMIGGGHTAYGQPTAMSLFRPAVIVKGGLSFADEQGLSVWDWGGRA